MGAGAQRYGRFSGCHATPMDCLMKDFGNLNIPHIERKNYRKISYFLGVMLMKMGRDLSMRGSILETTPMRSLAGRFAATGSKSVANF